MPNIKIFVDETLPLERRTELRSALLPIRDMLCQELKVDKSACQFAILSVMAMDDLPRVNVELTILPKTDRTRDVLTAVCRKLQEMIADVTGTHVAVRAANLDPHTYIALK